MFKALFLDRDGIINVDKGYVHKIEDFEFIDGIVELVLSYSRAGYVPVVVTNQSGIGRGYYTEDDFWVLSEWMTSQFQNAGLERLPIYFCPHHPQAAIQAYRQECHCRKPNPGMLLAAQRDLNLDLAASVMIGDSWRDIQAAFACGVRKYVYVSNSEPSSYDDYALIAPGLTHVSTVREIETK